MTGATGCNNAALKARSDHFRDTFVSDFSWFARVLAVEVASIHGGICAGVGTMRCYLKEHYPLQSCIDSTNRSLVLRSFAYTNWRQFALVDIDFHPRLTVLWRQWGWKKHNSKLAYASSWSGAPIFFDANSQFYGRLLIRGRTTNQSF